MFYWFERAQHVFFARIFKRHDFFSLEFFFLSSKQKKKIIFSPLAKKQKGAICLKLKATSSIFTKKIFHIISEGSFLLFTPDKNESFPFHACGRFFLLLFCERQPHHNWCKKIYWWSSNLRAFNHTFDVFPSGLLGTFPFDSVAPKKLSKNSTVGWNETQFLSQGKLPCCFFLFFFGGCESWVVRRGKTFGRWVGKFWKDIWTVWCMIQCFLVSFSQGQLGQ